MATLASRIGGGLIAKQGETEELRTRTGKRFRVSPTVRRVACSVGPIHYQADPFDADDEWNEIDLDVVLTPGESWDAACETNGYQVRLWQNLDRGGTTYRYVAQFRRAGRWLGMAPMAVIWTNNAGQRQVISAVQGGITPTIDNDANTVTWEDAFGEGLHWRYNLRPDQFAKTLIVTAKDNLPAPTINTNGLRLAVVVAVEWDTGASTSNGFAAGVTTGFGDGTITQPDETLDDPATFSHDDERGSLWHWQAPRAWDSSDPAQSVAVVWRLLRKANAVYAVFSVTAAQLNNAATVYPVFIDPTISEQVGVNSDHGYWAIGGSTFTNDPIVILFGNDSSVSYAMWSRFPDVSVPGGVTINSATLDLVSYSDRSTTTCNVTVSMEDADNPTNPTSAANADSRAITSATTAWSNVPAWTANTIYTTPNFATSLQEVIDRGGWAENNAANVFVKNNGSSSNASRYVKAYQLSSSDAPVLDVTYTSEPDPITVTPSAVSGTWSTVAPARQITHPAAPVSVTLSVAAPARALSYPAPPVSGAWSPAATAPSLARSVDAIAGSWSAPAPDLLRAVSIDAAAGAWSTVAPGRQLAIAPDPTTATWTATVPTVARTIDAAPLTGNWMATAPTSALALSADPIAGNWTPPNAANGLTAPVSPVGGQWQANATASSLEAGPAALAGSWSVVASTQAAVVSVSAAAGEWQTAAPTLAMAHAAAPLVATWTAPAVALAASIPVDPVTGSWSTPAVVSGQVFAVAPDPVSGSWSAVAPSPALQAPVSPTAGAWTTAASTQTVAIAAAPLAGAWSTTTADPSYSVSPNAVAGVWSTNPPNASLALAASPQTAAWTVAVVSIASDANLAISLEYRGQSVPLHYRSPSVVIGYAIEAGELHYSREDDLLGYTTQAAPLHWRG